jgi:hypothetical protein
MREIGPLRQDDARGRRRWFQDDYFDLFLWQDQDGRAVAFELCYDRNAAEGAVTWSEADGFAHARVDAGEQTPFVSMTPLHRAGGTPPYFRIYNRLLEATEHWEPQLRAFLLERLREYRRLLYGAHRTPRRRRAGRVG